MNLLLIFLGRLIIFISRLFNLGHGSTWPGHIALSVNKNFIKEIIKANPYLKIILIAGTNGKTTTGRLIQTILEKTNHRVFQNESGANLLNGIASVLILNSNILGLQNKDYAIFEVDENALPLVLKEFIPNYILILNLFRDQLDRYGEINTIAKKWKEALSKISPRTTLILNADDPQIAHLGLSQGALPSTPPRWNRSYTSVFYFGLDNVRTDVSIHQHASDSTYCPNCSKKLIYKSRSFSHLGNWYCPKCKYARPKLNLSSTLIYPLPGIYNRYNTLAAVLLAQTIGIDKKTIDAALHAFTPAFGRQEILKVNDKFVQLFLSKNPTSFNESLRTVNELKGKQLLLVLNDRIPDGTDVSWIWDTDIENYINKFKNITVSGDRVYDMALRIKYAQLRITNYELRIEENLGRAIKRALNKTLKNQTLYILPTYSAMLEVRKIITGRKIL